ncbi:hypothetical protein L914_13970 [Phytophthora nicotianae]|uniref:Uncharacterized protein n=1 Tax=Phytophthora nicotianae TaxID=4792 RepID=W2MU87_PHYNI|nr:hypothetical protein L914_13970 [Phytophthora nicotianae]
MDSVCSSGGGLLREAPIMGCVRTGRGSSGCPPVHRAHRWSIQSSVLTLPTRTGAGTTRRPATKRCYGPTTPPLHVVLERVSRRQRRCHKKPGQRNKRRRN